MFGTRAIRSNRYVVIDWSEEIIKKKKEKEKGAGSKGA